MAPAIQAATDELAQAEAEISVMFSALARDIGDTEARASGALRGLIQAADEWLKSTPHEPPDLSELSRLEELRDQLVRAATALERKSACDDEAMQRRSIASARSREPLPPRSGRDYDYFLDLREILNDEQPGSPPPT